MKYMAKEFPTVDILRFLDELRILCGRYNVLIKEETIRRNAPGAGVAFYEMQLSAKVDGSTQIDTKTLIE